MLLDSFTITMNKWKFPNSTKNRQKFYFFFEKSEEQNPVQVPVSWHLGRFTLIFKQKLNLVLLSDNSFTMENENYNNLYLILSNQPLPNIVPLQQQQQLIKTIETFYYQKQLYIQKG